MIDLKKPVFKAMYGDFIRLFDSSTKEVLDEATNLLKKQSNETIKRVNSKVESMGKNAWIKFEDIQIFTSFNDSLPNPLNLYFIIGWKAEAIGRAFVIKRLGVIPNKKRHPNKKCVPKKKRGKSKNRY
jgi:hypothetical protein